ncbi:MAG: outer membrane protein assembly factor BamD [Planctomycetota bacterium]
MSNRILLQILLIVALAAGAASCRAPYPYSQRSADEIYADAGIDIENGNGSGAMAKLNYLRDRHATFPDQEGVDFRFVEAKKLNEDYWNAFEDLREFLQKYRVTTRHAKSEELLFELGTTLLQSTSSLLGLGIARESDDGVLVLEYLREQFPNSRYGDEALRRMAQYRFESRDYQGAIRDYELILKVYPGSQWRDLAEYRIAIAHLRGQKRPDLDQSELLKARESLQNYLLSRPEGVRLDEAKAALRETEEKLAESEYKIGEFYRVVEQPFGAALHYKNAIVTYPGTEYAARAEERLAQMPAHIEPAPAKYPVKNEQSAP